MRAIRFASATAISMRGFRASMRASQDPAVVPDRTAARTTAMAPTMSSRRKCRTRRSRVLNVRPALCFWALFTATKRIVGRDAASAIASASAASVFAVSRTALRTPVQLASPRDRGHRSRGPSDGSSRTPPSPPGRRLGGEERQNLRARQLARLRRKAEKPPNRPNRPREPETRSSPSRAR